MFEIVENIVMKDGWVVCVADAAHLSLWEEILELRSQLSISEMISSDLSARINEGHQRGLGQK